MDEWMQQRGRAVNRGKGECGQRERITLGIGERYTEVEKRGGYEQISGWSMWIEKRRRRKRHGKREMDIKNKE